MTTQAWIAGALLVGALLFALVGVIPLALLLGLIGGALLIKNLIEG